MGECVGSFTGLYKSHSVRFSQVANLVSKNAELDMTDSLLLEQKHFSYNNY